MSTYDFDLFTIGAGSGGVRASRFAAQYGARVAIAEQQYLGGTCVNVGCIPKKLMSYAAHFPDDFSDARGFGWTLGEAAFDWKTLIANKDREIERLNEVYRKLLKDSGVRILEGHAQILDAHTVSIDGRLFTSRHILIATGGKPTLPELPGCEHGLTSDDFFRLNALPNRALVCGGGYIAVELASILNGLGCEVTLAYRGTQLLRTMDADLGVFLAQEMTKKGIDILFEADLHAISEDAGDHSIKQVTFKSAKTIETDCVLFATGRHANTRGLGLENTGVRMHANGAVMVDDNFCSNVASIHAIGDVVDRIALTPVALAEGMIVAARLFNGAKATMSYDKVPTAVFSHPNVATVGLTEAAARQVYGKLRIFKTQFRPLKHTLSGSGERVFMKLIVDDRTDRVLGVHMVGAEAGEIIQGFAVALQCNATKAQFDATIGIHPTMAEEFVTMRTAL
ncbi:glutathione-disulfide reductase [Glaciimonas sp. PCH181]|uniref:glutathione-disulfide reductase n=1 Tax=Glaciimonas sp. PCH181 TaxID=2133943 RepID=UPI000D39A9A4|nr:glutathione-disulfide reductase [Glaciimonas sp. PCH181]PUA19186.1 glutathione-disulfide reductase [Glaciimonas sp. PCH181]